MFNVKWTGSYPNLCSGHWVIKHGEQYLSLPEDRQRKPMGTLKMYESWYFDDDFKEVWEEYSCGQGKEDWIEANLY